MAGMTHQGRRAASSRNAIAARPAGFLWDGRASGGGPSFDAALQKPLAVGTRAFDSLLARARASKANAGTKQSDTPNR